MARFDPRVSWAGDGPPRDPVPIGPTGWFRVLGRGAVILALLVPAFVFLLLLRLPERLIWRECRPLTPRLTQAVCRAVCALMGLKRRQGGRPVAGPVAHVANHTSWLDVFVLNSLAPVFFVAKSEVRGWPGIGWLARGTGTLFVRRRRVAAKEQQNELAARLTLGHRMMIFPEGTSTDGQRVLPFKSTIFAAFFAAEVPADTVVQPVSLRYVAPPGREARFYGWWHNMGFLRSMLEVLAQAPQGRVDVIWGAPIPVAGLNRKTLAAQAETAVRASFFSAGEPSDL